MTFHKVKRVHFGFKTEKKMLQVKLDTWEKRVDKRKMEHCTCVHAEVFKTADIMYYMNASIKELKY